MDEELHGSWRKREFECRDRFNLSCRAFPYVTVPSVLDFFLVVLASSFFDFASRFRNLSAYGVREEIVHMENSSFPYDAVRGDNVDFLLDSPKIL